MAKHPHLPLHTNALLLEPGNFFVNRSEPTRSPLLASRARIQSNGASHRPRHRTHAPRQHRQADRGLLRIRPRGSLRGGVGGRARQSAVADGRPMPRRRNAVTTRVLRHVVRGEGLILEKVAVEEAVGGDSGGRGRIGVSGRGHGCVVKPLVRFQRALYCLFGGRAGHCEARPLCVGPFSATA